MDSLQILGRGLARKRVWCLFCVCVCVCVCVGGGWYPNAHYAHEGFLFKLIIKKHSTKHSTHKQETSTLPTVCQAVWWIVSKTPVAFYIIFSTEHWFEFSHWVDSRACLLKIFRSKSWCVIWQAYEWASKRYYYYSVVYVLLIFTRCNVCMLLNLFVSCCKIWYSTQCM